MDHPNIARVFDAGATQAGRPYFVMELVRGVPITDYCDQNSLPVHDRLELFVTVCHSVQHAHQKGIIHRDIKPSNVLVTLHDGRPVPKVIDFGVAKAIGQRLTEKTLYTHFAQMLGTPLYMSPEQAELTDLDIDTRGDIYSLGVLLYELLTGTTPFEQARIRQAAWDEVRRMLRDEEPPAPSMRLSSTAGRTQSVIAAQRRVAPGDLGRLVRGDLDWIVMKALEKDRARRYDTANSFAADVARYLSDEPVQARPPSAAYRFHKFARRNRAAITSALVLAMALVLGTAISTWQAIRATSAEHLAQARLQDETAARNDAEAARQAETAQRHIAEAQRTEAEKMRSQAEANFRQARQAVDDMYTQVAEKWLAHQPQMEPVQREFLQKALRFYAEFASQTSVDPAVRLETARAYRRVTEIQARLGETTESEHAAREAIQRLQELVDENPSEPVYRQELADCLHKFGVLLGDIGRYAEGEQVQRRALALQEKLAADFPDVTEYRRDLGRGYWFLGSLLESIASGQAVAQALRSAMPIQTRLVAEFPSVPEYREHLADTYASLAFWALWTGQPEKSLEGFRDAASIIEKLVAEFPAEPRYRNELAVVYYRRSLILPPGQAEQSLRSALDLQEKLAADFPAVPDHRYDLARSHAFLGLVLRRAGRLHEAEEAYRQATVIGDKLIADSPAVHYYLSRLGEIYAGLAGLLENSGRLPEAEAAYRRAIGLYEQYETDFPNVNRGGPDLNSVYIALGSLLSEAGRPEDAAEVRRKADQHFRSRRRPAVVPSRKAATMRELIRDHQNLKTPGDRP